MSDRLTRLEARIDELSRGLAEVQRRLAIVEARAPRSSSLEKAAAPAATPAPGQLVEPEIASDISLLGRTLLVLGGAYLLRALTDNQLLPQTAGAGLGLVYAAFWFYLADRAARCGRKASATFHGAAAALVAYPLLWETTSRFQLFSPAAAAIGLGLMTALGLVVSWRGHLQPLAWISFACLLLSSLALVASTKAPAPFAASVVAVAVVVLWLAYDRGWPGLRWAAAGAADSFVLLLTAGALIQKSNVSLSGALWIQLALAAVFLAVFFRQALVEERDPGLFEALQSGAVLLLGYGGGLVVARAGGEALKLPLFFLGLALAAFCYRTALARSTERETTTGLYFSGAALLVLLLAASGLPAGRWLFWSATAGLACWMGARLSRASFGWHGAVYLVAAAAAAGLLTFSAYAFLARSQVAWPHFSAAMIYVLAAAALCIGLESSRGEAAWWAELPQLIEMAVLVLGAGALLLTVAVPRLAGQPGADIDAARLATVRTGVLSASAVLLGAAARRPRLRQASWLVYPVLLACGIKLVIEDFPQGRPATLFVALAVYGGALLAAPRISRPSL